MTDYSTTGDGLMAGLQFLAEMVRTGKKASELAAVFDPVPQLLKNVRFQAGQTPWIWMRLKRQSLMRKRDCSQAGVF